MPIADRRRTTRRASAGRRAPGRRFRTGALRAPTRADRPHAADATRRRARGGSSAMGVAGTSRGVAGGSQQRQGQPRPRHFSGEAQHVEHLTARMRPSAPAARRAPRPPRRARSRRAAPRSRAARRARSAATSARVLPGEEEPHEVGRASPARSRRAAGAACSDESARGGCGRTIPAHPSDSMRLAKIGRAGRPRPLRARAAPHPRRRRQSPE